MAYGPGDRPGGAKPRKRKPAAPSPAVREAHAQRARDVAKAGAAKRYISNVVKTPVLENDRAKGRGTTGGPAPGTAMENERAKGRGPTTATRPRTYLDWLPGTTGKRRSATDDELVRHNVEKLFSEQRNARERAEAAEALQGLGVLPGGKASKPLTIRGTEIPRGPGGGHTGKFHGQVADAEGYLHNAFVDKNGNIISDPGHLDDLIKGIRDIYSAPGKVGLGLPGSKNRTAALGPSYRSGPVSHILHHTVGQGLTATGGLIMEGLDRPAGATEAAVAKGLVAAGVITGPEAARIRRAPGPGHVLSHGRDWSKDITGASLARGVGLPEQLGLGADLVIDPVMWAGLGLAAETDGTSLALVRARLTRMAPALLKEPRVAKVLSDFDEHGNEKKALRQLRGLIKPAKVGKAQSAENRRIVTEAMANDTKLHLQVPKRRLRNGLRKRLEIQETRLPGNAADVVQEALRHGEARRVKPQVRLNLMTPLGRRTRVGVNIPDLGLLARTPTRMRVAKKDIDAAKRAARIHMTTQMDEHVHEINARIEHLVRTKQPAEKILALRRERQAIIDVYLKKTQEAVNLAESEVKRRTLGDVVAGHNERIQATHSARVASQDFGRMLNAKYAQAIERATKVIPLGGNREKSLKRVQMYLNTWADTKGTGLKHLAETIGPMTSEEQTAFLNLRRLYRRQGEHDVKQGVLRQTLDDYVGQRQWDPGEITAGGGRRGMTTSFQQHRAVAAVADYADPQALAESLKSLSNNAISDDHALAAAERLWTQGHVRTVADLTRASLLRGNTIMWQDLTAYEKSAIARAATVGLLHDREVPLFRTPFTDETTEGQVLLNNSDEAVRAYNLDVGSISDDQKIPQQILSAVADRQRVADLHGSAAGPVKADLTKMHERLSDEIQNTELGPWADEAQADVHTRTANLNEAEELPAQEERLRRARIAISEAQDAGHDTSALDDELHSATQAYNEAVDKNPMAGAAKAATEAEHADLQRIRLQVSNIQEALTTGDPAKLRAVAPGVYTAEADANGDLWLRGIRNGDAPPIQGITPRPNEALPHADPFNMYSSLPDFRAKPLTGEMVNLDPRSTGYTRARAAGMSAAWHARWQGFDQQFGRSAKEELTQVYHIPETGEMGLMSELFPVRNEDGFVTGFIRRGDDSKEVIDNAAGIIEIKKGSLIPDAKHEYWLNTETGEEYTRPRNVFETGLMLHNLDEDRLWPTQAIEQLKLDSVRSGEMDTPLDAMYNDALTHGFQKVMGLTRFAVTSPFPAYHIRNLMSDLIKSIQADSGVLFHPITNFKMMSAAAGKGLDWNIKVKGYPKMKMEDFLFMADMFGVKSGHHVAEVASLLHHGDFTNTRVQNMLRHGIFSPLTPGGITTKLGAQREDIVRYMTFMQRMRTNGGDAADAAWYVTRHHFNYNDLSGVERKYVRNLFLFYTWYRKNIPLQLVELVRRPGFFAGISHTYNALSHGQTPLNVGPFSGAAPQQPYLPDYVKNKLLSATVNWNDHALNVGFGAPYADLSFVSTEGVGDLISLLTPPAAIAAQLKFRQDPLTGRRYKTNEPSGVATAYNEIYHYLTGHDLPVDENGSPTLPWRLSIALRQAPFLGRATYSLGASAGTRDQGRFQRYGRQLGNLTGLNIYMSPTPGSEREDATGKKFLSGQVSMERRQAQEDLSNFPTDSPFYKHHLTAQDQAAIEFLRERGIPISMLEKIKNSGFYEGAVRIKRGGLGSGGSSGTLGGGTLGG